MADNTAGATQADADASTSSQADNTTSSATQADADTTISLDEARKLRAESKSLRDRLRSFEDAEKKRQDAQLSDQERTTKQLADLQRERDDAVKQAQTLKISNAVSSQAARLGFADPDDAIRFLDASEIDANASNVESLLKDLLKSKPYLAGTQRASSGGATNPSRSQANANQGITEEFVDRLLAGKESVKYEDLSKAQQNQIAEILDKRQRLRYR